MKKSVKTALFVATAWVTSSLATSVHADGAAVFEKNCATCHELPNPDKPPSEGWAKRLDLMAPMAGLDDAQKQEVLAYLQSHSKAATQTVVMAEDRKLFEQKCSLCHTPDRVLDKPLTADSRRHIVMRMQERAPGWITPDDAEKILAYISQAPEKTGKPGKTKFHQDESADKLEPRMLFHKRCSACHTLERVYLNVEKGADAEAWNHIVQRMESKDPSWLSDEEAQKILTYLRTLKPVAK
jgi:mono/diheme cytochrome c family protein